MKGCPAKVSVIIPVYNTEAELNFCLSSCVEQTLFDFEIICVNDGSTDGSLKVLEAFEQKDNRIRIINKKNGGLSSARNAGLDAANGEIIMFLDSDDRLARNACERVWCEFLEGEFDILAFGTKFFPTIPAPDPWLVHRLQVPTHRVYGFNPSVLFMETGAKPFVWRQAFRKGFLDKNKIRFDEKVKYGEDTVFDMEAYPHGKNFAFISDNLYFYRWKRQGSLMASASKDWDKKLEQHLYLCEVITEYWNHLGWLDKYGDWYFDWMLDFVVPDILKRETKSAALHFQRLARLIKKYHLDSKYADKLNAMRREYLSNILRA